MSVCKRLLENIELTNRRRGLFKKGQSLLVAVSGGPDSTALLALLSILRKKYHLKLHVAHLNHGLLPQQGRRHAQFTKKLAQEFQTPYYGRKISVREFAKKSRRSLEEAGRLMRYHFFEEVAGRAGCQKIATAHTLDDQAETVLMRVLRGSGLKGLGGIPFKRRSGRFEVIRPLLDCRKEELRSFLRESKIRTCADQSNRDLRFFRNRVRWQLLPWLEKSFNPQIKRSLSSLRNISEELQGYVESMSRRSFKKCLLKRTRSALILDEARLRCLHPAILKEVFFQAVSDLCGDARQVDYAHMAAIEEILKSPKTPLETHLPSHLLVRKSNGRLEFLVRN